MESPRSFNHMPGTCPRSSQRLGSTEAAFESLTMASSCGLGCLTVRWSWVNWVPYMTGQDSKIHIPANKHSLLSLILEVTEHSIYPNLLNEAVTSISRFKARACWHLSVGGMSKNLLPCFITIISSFILIFVISSLQVIR